MLLDYYQKFVERKINEEEHIKVELKLVTEDVLSKEELTLEARKFSALKGNFFSSKTTFQEIKILPHESRHIYPLYLIITNKNTWLKMWITK